MPSLQVHMKPTAAAHLCARACGPAPQRWRMQRPCFTPMPQQVPNRRCVIVAALSDNPEDEKRLRAALERQIKRSIQKIESEQAAALTKRSKKDIDKTARKVSKSIVEAVNANPDASSLDVLRDLATRTPLLSDEQLLTAIERQIQSAQLPRKSAPPPKQESPDVNIGFVPVVVSAPDDKQLTEPVLSVDEEDVPIPAPVGKKKVGLLDEDQLKAALERQLKRSLEAKQAESGGEGDVTPLAHALTEEIVEAVKADPNHDSVKVLKELGQRVSLLSDGQLYSALARQLADSSLTQEEETGTAVPAPSSDLPNGNGVAQPEEPVVPEKSPYAPDRELDGCLVFTSDQLSAVDYNALLEKLLGPQLTGKA